MIFRDISKSITLSMISDTVEYSPYEHLKKHVIFIHRQEKHFICNWCDYALYHRGNIDKHDISVHE